nr:hydantoinase B/oxoprolinase family protein [Sphingomonas sp. Y57]
MVDAITAEIIRNNMECTTAEIISSMVRSSVSPLFNEAHDCAAGIFYYDNGKAELIARADAVPVHVYGSLTSVQACLDFFQGDLNQGDVIIVTDPYYGGTHIPDYTIVKPVFYEGQPLFFPSVRGHMLDAGGPVPSSISSLTREIWHDGCRLAPMKLYEKGEIRQEVWDFLMANNRLPSLTTADLYAMIGACRLGEERIRTLCDKYGLETLREAVNWIFDYSERKMRDQIRQWPQGRYNAKSILDTDYTGRSDLQVAVSITVGENSIEVDFTESSEQSKGIVNSVPGNTLSYVYGVFSALCNDIPVNSGFFRPITIKLPKGSVVDPIAPASTIGSTVNIGCDIGDAVMKACEGFAPDRVGTASIDTLVYFAFGIDARTGQYCVHYDYNINPTASGATRGVDGWGAWPAPFAALTLPSIEVSEIQYPCLYRQCGDLVTDSAAPGQWRGSAGHAMLREVRGTVSGLLNEYMMQGLRHPLHGFVGGREACGNYGILRPGQPDEVLITEVGRQLPSQNGDACFFLCSGGGGWGDPLDRDSASVLDDVLDDYVSIEGAAHDYGVVIDPEALTVDEEATSRTRSQLRVQRESEPDWLAYGRKQVLERVGLLQAAAA